MLEFNFAWIWKLIKFKFYFYPIKAYENNQKTREDNRKLE